MTRLVIVGAGGHARELLDAVEAINERRPEFDFLGFLADGEEHPDLAEARGANLLGSVEALPELDALYAIGIGAPAVRQRVDALATAGGCTPATIVHPAASVGSAVELGPGCYVGAGAVITTHVVLGRHTHVDVAASVSHDVVVGDHCTIAPGSRIAGWVRLGHRVDVGIGAVFRDRVFVGDDAIVAAGAVVVADVAPATVVAGVPAKPMR